MEIDKLEKQEGLPGHKYYKEVAKAIYNVKIVLNKQQTFTEMKNL